jgi:hypothetical protein
VVPYIKERTLTGMGEIINVKKNSFRKPEGKKDQLGDLGADGRIILKWINEI